MLFPQSRLSSNLILIYLLPTVHVKASLLTQKIINQHRLYFNASLTRETTVMHGVYNAAEVTPQRIHLICSSYSHDYSSHLGQTAILISTFHAAMEGHGKRIWENADSSEQLIIYPVKKKKKKSSSGIDSHLQSLSQASHSEAGKEAEGGEKEQSGEGSGVLTSVQARGTGKHRKDADPSFPRLSLGN